MSDYPRRLDEGFFGRLNVPVVGEAEAIEELRKSGASPDDIDAATWAWRLLGSLPEDVAKALDPNADDEDEDEDKDVIATPVEKTPEEKERLAAEARRFNESMRKHLERNKMEKAEKERRAAMSTVEKADEAMRILKDVERLDDKRVLERIESYSARLRKEDPTLTKVQAEARAWRENPEEYNAYQRDALRKQGWLNDSSTDLRKEADAYAPIAAAVANVRKEDPTLSEATATARVLRENPSLYAEYERNK